MGFLLQVWEKLRPIAFSRSNPRLTPCAATGLAAAPATICPKAPTGYQNVGGQPGIGRIRPPDMRDDGRVLTMGIGRIEYGKEP